MVCTFRFRAILIATLSSLLILSACGDDLDDDDPIIELDDPDSEQPDHGENSGDNNVSSNNDAESNDDSAPNNDTEPNNDTAPNNNTDPVDLGEPPVPGVDPSWAGGHSVDDRAIVVEYYGNNGPILYFTSGIHGQERLAVTYAERFRTYLNAGYAEQHGIQVVLMQSTNPDGTDIYERYNTNGVDLNRNFPTNNYEPGPVGGPEAMSEPETAAMKNVIDASNLTAALTLHCCAPTFDPDGPGEELAAAMSNAMDSEYRFPPNPLGAASGSMGSYVGLDMGKPIITVEFAGSLSMDPLIQLNQMDLAVDAAGLWTAQNGETQVVSFNEMNTEDDWSYRSRYAGTSAGGLPLRLESAGTSSENSFVLLSGFDGSSLLGAWIAEHIRRELLAVPGLDMPLWRMITAVNPDGLAAGTATNEDGVDVITATIEGVEEGLVDSDEVAAVVDALDDTTATVFLVLSSPDGTDRVDIVGDRRDELIDSIPSRFEVGISSADRALADAIAAHGHTVVQIMVGTENAEAQLEPGNWVDFDQSLNSPFDFSEMVLEMSYE